MFSMFFIKNVSRTFYEHTGECGGGVIKFLLFVKRLILHSHINVLSRNNFVSF